MVDENGNTLHSFDSHADCGKFLNVDPSTISKRIKKGIPFLERKSPISPFSTMPRELQVK